MKQLFTFLFFIASLQSYAQVTVTGTITGFGEKIIIGYWKDFTYVSDTIRLNASNQFHFQYPVNEVAYIRLGTIEPTSNTPFFIVLPNESLNIIKSNAGTFLDGSLKEYNKLLLLRNEDLKTAFKNTKPDYNALTDYLLDRSDKFFQSFVHPKSRMIRDLDNLYIITNYKLYPITTKYGDDTLRMKALYDYLSKPGNIDGNNKFLKYLDRINFNSENIGFANIVDISMMNNIIRVLRMQAVKKDSTLKNIDEYLIESGIIKELFTATRYRSRLLGYNLYSRIEQYTEHPTQLAGVNEFINDYKQERYNKGLLPAIQNIYASNLATIGTLSKGAVAPLFKLPNQNGELISLNDLKGKVVYLDLWASWCSPCLKEMPYLEKLKAKYIGKNIEMVSISIDTKKESWLKKVADLKLSGMQLIDSNGSENSKIAKDYKIHGVPHYILIDKTGKIASAFAPRPSSETDIINEINKLLK